MSFSTLLSKASGSCAPILGEVFAQQEVCAIDLAKSNPELAKFAVQHYEGLQNYLDFCLNRHGAKVAMGGYLEQRLLYQTSSHFGAQQEQRCIHLGVDLWAAVGTDVYAPLEGRVHSFRYNDKYLDYGATIILSHELEGQQFYSLYGHLSLESLEGLTKGKLIKKGSSFAQMGARHENGAYISN